ncbi:hypothetical protein EJ04DRAFT_509076 [Polyplosphaeria fusca]|uniref:DUF7708 domain-containing protein n=1 Tax=Polyplosphaeria fusca TaxID=682080 RepID=A0A9P4R8S0_9PLEO|nr:hypothetical protein EJ04DRAFT_509076 [Polyplosphaeria fusca]
MQHQDIAQEAYATACAFITTEFQGSNDTKTLLQPGHSINDVFALLERAKAQYDEKSGRKTLKWLSKVASRIGYYGQVMDVLAQHHPEYVALAWGAVKFILMGILNHERLVTEFSRAIAEIGGALREVSVAAELFQTDDMQIVVSQLYAQILTFILHSIKWYKRSRIGRVFSSVFSPYELEYEETIQQIKLCARNVKTLGDSKNWAEVRDMNISIELLRRDVTQLQETVDSNLKIATCNKTLSERIHIDIQDLKADTRDIQLSHILDSLSPGFCPYDGLTKLKSIVKRSRSLRLPSGIPMNVLRSLNNWFSREGSSLFVLRVEPRAEGKAREISTDIISLLQKKGVKVIWRLSSIRPGADVDEPPSLVQVLQVLIYQALLLVPKLHSYLNISTFRSAHTEAEWTSLFRTALSHVEKCYIVIDTQDVFQAAKGNQEWMSSFLGIFRDLACETTSRDHVLKFLVLCYGGGTETKSGTECGAVLKKPAVVPMRCKKMVHHKRGLQGWKGVQPKL